MVFAGPRVEVADPLAALARPRHGRPGWSAATVVAVTGSNGKTTTKNLLAAALGTRLTVANQASFNSEVGLPLTLTRIEPETRAVVVEMGARGPGHIAALARLARPTVGVVVNVGESHLGMFGSREAIAKAKGELVESLPPTARPSARRRPPGGGHGRPHGGPGGHLRPEPGRRGQGRGGRPRRRRPGPLHPPHPGRDGSGHPARPGRAPGRLRPGRGRGATVLEVGPAGSAPGSRRPPVAHADAGRRFGRRAHGPQ